MSDLLMESMLMSFDSQARLVWSLVSATEANAAFDHGGDKVTVTFVQTSAGEWRVAFEVARSAHTPSELVRSSIRIFSGVFQAVEEFLTVRQPERLVFASKEEGLGRLYETYLSRQNTALGALGYRSEPIVASSPLAEYAIYKTSSSAWSDAGRS